MIENALSTTEAEKVIDASYDEFQAGDDWRECVLSSCGASFKADGPTRYYCSPQCAWEGLKQRDARKLRERAAIIEEVDEGRGTVTSSESVRRIPRTPMIC